MLAVASMQQKCKIREMSDTIRRKKQSRKRHDMPDNRRCKNLHDQVDKLDQLQANFVNLVKFVMQFFYTLHNESFVLIHAPSILRSNE
jgi:hypothetical protein